MKKWIFKRLLIFALAMAMLIQMIPVRALAAEEDDYICLEVTTGKTLRVEPYESSEVFAKVEPGDVLIAEDFVTNKYGNLWYKILCPGGDYAFIYNENVKEHTHELVEAGDTLMYCRCGCIVKEKGDTRQIFGDVVAPPRPVFGPDDIATLGALWTGVKAGAVAALPYLGVVVVCGTVIYIAVSVHKAGIIVEEVTHDWKKLDKDFKPDKGIYFDGLLGKNALFVDVANPMDRDEALEKLEGFIRFSMMLLERKQDKRDDVFWFIYTLDESDARNLASEYVNTHFGYTFNRVIENHGAKTENEMMRQFQHYHITPDCVPYPTDKGSHLGGHIAFGAPKGGTFGGGAWKQAF